MEINFALSILEQMNIRIRDEKIFQRWIPYQSEMNFEEFKKQVLNSSKSKKDSRTSKEILKNVEKILADLKL